MKYVWVKNEVTIGMLSYFLKIFYLQVFKVIMSVKILSWLTGIMVSHSSWSTFNLSCISCFCFSFYKLTRGYKNRPTHFRTFPTKFPDTISVDTWPVSQDVIKDSLTILQACSKNHFKTGLKTTGALLSRQFGVLQFLNLPHSPPGVKFRFSKDSLGGK